MVAGVAGFYCGSGAIGIWDGYCVLVRHCVLGAWDSVHSAHYRLASVLVCGICIRLALLRLGC